MSLSSAEKSRHNNVNALFFSASSKTGLFFSFFFSHRSQVATSYFCPLAAGGADLIQHIQASRTPCCSPPHSRMDADEAQGRGHRAGYSAIIMYLQKKNTKKTTSEYLILLLVLFLCPMRRMWYLKLCSGVTLRMSPFIPTDGASPLPRSPPFCTSMFSTEARNGQTEPWLLETTSGVLSGQHANTAWCH